MASLHFDSVGKIYRTHGRKIVAVNELNLHVGDGEIVGLLGASGCGKTTALRAVAGFVTLTSGAIRINDEAIHHQPPSRRGVAMAFEGYALYPPLRVRDNIGFALLRSKVQRDRVNKAVREIASLMNIEDILENRPSTISAGQQQRTSLARALIRRAPVTLLDEPMSQLEPQLRSLVRARVKEYLSSNRLTTVFVTHDQNEATLLADRIAVMNEGQLQQCAAPAELKKKPANLFVAGFIGEPPMNLISAVMDSDSTGGTVFTLLHDGAPAAHLYIDGRHTHDVIQNRVCIGVRPHHIILSDDAPLRGQVLSCQWLGNQTHLLIDINGLRLVTVSLRRIPQSQLTMNIGVHFPPHAINFFDESSGVALHFNATDSSLSGI